ncbi:MAG: DUF4363 family protein [Clostridia bacterium]|nr:DUF4363 family protein [Clostridia bacterium]
MKTFYAAIALFLLLLCLILANTLFLHRVTDELELRLHKISTENAYGALQELESYWQQKKRILGLSIPTERLNRLQDRITEMKVLLDAADAAGFAHAHALALSAVEQLRESESLSPEHLL